MAYDKLQVVFEPEKIQEATQVFRPKDYPDKEIKELFKDFDYILRVNDYNKIIEASRLKKELEKMGMLKIRFEQENDLKVQKETIVETDELLETNSREILNRQLVRNAKTRGLKIRADDNIYFENKEDLSYAEMKGYYINLILPYKHNRDFDFIARRLKNIIANKNQQFTTFQTLIMLSDNKRDYAIIIPEMTYNNERFTRHLYKTFLPFTSLVAAEICQIMVKEADGWQKSKWWTKKIADKRVLNLA